LIVKAFIDSLSVAVTFTPIETPVVLLAGVTEVTVGGVVSWIIVTVGPVVGLLWRFPLSSTARDLIVGDPGAPGVQE